LTRRRHLVAIVTLLVVAIGVVVVPTAGTAGSTSLHAQGGSPSLNPVPLAATPPVSACPWLASAMAHKRSPQALAALVLSRMTIREKLGEVVLTSSHGYENLNQGVPRLCIPPLTLQDGPQGLAYGDTGVTQLPSPLGIAATFDPSVARQYGQVLGSEARGQGIDVVQSPNLNIDRVPQNGRGYEGFGEDPLLVSTMGVAEIAGIQSQGTLAQAKHLVAYNQETDRGQLNTVVSQRALHEIYLPPFKAAVRQAHVSSVMCAYPKLNGVFQCQDPTLVKQLDSWGFTGFVRSDLGAVHDPVAALGAGTDLIKPASVARLATSVSEGVLPVSDVDNAVLKVLSVMFASGLVRRVPAGKPGTPVDTLAHGIFARTAAERSTVLLKDQGAVLPLRARSKSTIAVIGASASDVPVTTGYGSSQVTADFTSTPLDAIRNAARSGTTIRYVDGGSTTRPYPAIPSRYLAPSTGKGNGLTLTVQPNGAPVGATPIQTLDPNVDVAIRSHPSVVAMLPPVTANPRPDQIHRVRPGRIGVIRGRTALVLPAGWADVTATWTGTLTPPRTGLYSFSISGSGGATLALDGAPVVADPESHVSGVWAASANLTAGHAYKVLLTWDPFDSNSLTGRTTIFPSSLALGWEYASAPIAQAVKAARSAKVAVVFAGDFNSEGYDRPSLALPGDQNALIAAVAAVNPHTVVVIQTGGPVTMPWLPHVAGVVVDWYPGEEGGAAIAAVLFGSVDPSGRLPVTFPVSLAQSAINSPSQWPGVNLVSTYSEGLQVGYRYDAAHGIRPLFPFGFGLSYTHFTQQLASVTRTATGWAVRVHVTNTGSVAGTDVPQAYLTFPTAAAEPPDKLVAFSPVTLAPSKSATVVLTVPDSAFAAYLGSSWTTVPGAYTLSVGESSQNLPLRATVSMP
jgi:beta-glucosidase